MVSKTFQGMPMRHRGVHVGNFFLAGKEGVPGFTSEDEEVLSVFAAQAIANARAHRAGRVLDMGDALIAGTAVAHALSIATRNVRDFDGLDIDVVNPWDAP